MSINDYIKMLDTETIDYIISRIVIDNFDLTDGVPPEARKNYFENKLNAIDSWDDIKITKIVKLTENTKNVCGESLSDYLLFLFDVTEDGDKVIEALKDSYKALMG